LRPVENLLQPMVHIGTPPRLRPSRPALGKPPHCCRKTFPPTPSLTSSHQKFPPPDYSGIPDSLSVGVISLSFLLSLMMGSRHNTLFPPSFEGQWFSFGVCEIYEGAGIRHINFTLIDNLEPFFQLRGFAHSLNYKTSSKDAFIIPNESTTPTSGRHTGFFPVD